MGDLAGPGGDQEKNVLQPLTDVQHQVYQQQPTVSEAETVNNEKFVKPLSDLPETFSLLAKINVPYDITAQEILSMSGKRIQKSADFEPLFDEEARAPSPPLPPEVDDRILEDTSKLLCKKPICVVDTEAYAMGQSIQTHCKSSPIVLIRYLMRTVNFDFSLFSSETISESNPSQQIDQRTQHLMSPDKNINKSGKQVWDCYSCEERTTIAKYAKYQKKVSKEKAEKPPRIGSKRALQSTESHGSKRRKVIKFGTNVDLSDAIKWAPQLKEIEKLPPFFKVTADGNMLSHLGHQVYGMNTVQLYMKVTGSKTPAHQENNSIASININVGPGDCEWFGCAYEYWGVIEKLCKKHGIDFLKDSYWPNLKELLAENVPVYRFTQKPGDLVWVGSGCVHWVQALGVCNNVSWNVGPFSHHQLSMSIRSHEFNKVRGYKSLVPMQHMAWQLAKTKDFTDRKLYDLIRGLLIRSLSFCKYVMDYATANGKQLKPQSRTKGEFAHYCTSCKIEVFNILFIKEVKTEFQVYCVYCLRKEGLNEYAVIQQITISELSEIYDGMRFIDAPKPPCYGFDCKYHPCPH